VRWESGATSPLVQSHTRHRYGKGNYLKRNLSQCLNVGLTTLSVSFFLPSNWCRNIKCKRRSSCRRFSLFVWTDCVLGQIILRKEPHHLSTVKNILTFSASNLTYTYYFDNVLYKRRRVSIKTSAKTVRIFIHNHPVRPHACDVKLHKTPYPKI
jgi:hypothetical protein